LSRSRCRQSSRSRNDHVVIATLMLRMLHHMESSHPWRAQGRRLVRAVLAGALTLCTGASMAELRLASTIELPDTHGRIDHLAIDQDHGELFVAALGANTTEVIDRKAGKRVARIQSGREPQGVVYVAAGQRLLVAHGGDGTVRAFVAGRHVGTVDGLPDAD